MLATFLAAAVATAGAPIGTIWAGWHETHIVTHGEALPAHLIEWAGNQGVQHPDRVRVLHADTIPLPAPMFVRELLANFGYPTTSVGGLCLRYGIYLQTGIEIDSETTRHELIHTLQYERSRSLPSFLFTYLWQTIEHGYIEAPLEREAQQKARDDG